MAVQVSNTQWRVSWDEQHNELRAHPAPGNEGDGFLTLTGSKAKGLVALIQVAMELPSGDNPG